MALLRRTRHGVRGRALAGGPGEHGIAERHHAPVGDRHRRQLGRARAEMLQLSSDLLTAILAVEGRTRATLDDLERADALALLVLARQRRREAPH
jgi:Mg-chelatase subunit ChlI